MGDPARQPADRFELLGLEELVLRGLADADVADRGGDQDPLGASSGLSMISIGNSLPSLRRPESPMPVPICCARASAAERRPSAISRSAKPSGMMLVTCWPIELVARIAELLLGLEVQQDDLAGPVDHDHGVRRSFEQPAVAALHCARCSSAALRTLMSRIAAVTRIPSALSSGLSMISIGNSLPSLRRAESSMPVPICCARRLRGGAQVVGDQSLGEALRDDVGDLLADSSSRG